MTAREQALARMLEDWEAGRMTAIEAISCHLTTLADFQRIAEEGLVAFPANRDPKGSPMLCLTPVGFMAAHEARAGLAAARRAAQIEESSRGD